MEADPFITLTIQSCQTMCEHMITYLLGEPDVKDREMQIRYLRDCADICSLTSSYISRSSTFERTTAQLCYAICKRCGEECAKFQDKESQSCSVICLNCAEECKKFARL